MNLLLLNWDEIGQETLNILKKLGMNFANALGIFIVGFLLIRVIVILLRKIFSKTKVPKVTYKFIISVTKFSLYLLLLLVICQAVGIPTTGFVALVSAAGLALSLALQGSLSNLANGVVIISTQPFKEGDYISVNGHEGTVIEMKMLHTIIKTPDNKRISIPNSKIVENELINYNINVTRRVNFDFSVDYATDVDKAKEIIISVMKSSNLVFTDPAPFCELKTLGSSSINLFAYCWCYGKDYWTVYYYVMDNVFNELKRNNINIPFGQMEVRLRNDEVKMPYREQELPERNVELAVKPYIPEDGDIFDKALKNFKKKHHKKPKEPKKAKEKVKKEKNKK